MNAQYSMINRPAPVRSICPLCDDEGGRTIHLSENLPKGVTIGRWRDGRTKQWYVRYGRREKLISFREERERNDFTEKLVTVLREDGAVACEWDPKEWAEYRAFQRRVGLSIREIEQILTDLRRTGERLSGAKNPGTPDREIL